MTRLYHPSIKRMVLIVPPPFVEQRQFPPNTRIPEQVQTAYQRHEELFHRYFQFSPPVSSSLEAFNDWINMGLPYRIAAREIPLSDGRITFDPTSVQIESPSITLVQKGRIPDYPQLCREDQRTYSMSIYVTPYFVPNDGSAPRKLRQLYVGQIPVLLGSNADNLFKMTREEKLAYGECPNDPLGYCVIEGVERIVLIQEKLRNNRPLLYWDPKKSAALVKITCTHPRGTSQIIVREVLAKERKKKGMETLDLKTIEVAMAPLEKDKSIPVFSLYALLGMNDPNEMIGMVSEFIDPKNRKKAQFQLLTSLQHYLSLSTDPDEIAAELTRTRNASGKDETLIKRAIKETDGKTKTEIVAKLFADELFPLVPDYRQKLIHLSLLVARLVEYMIGVRQLDGRDSWSNKALITPAKAMAQLFDACWRLGLDTVAKDAKMGETPDHVLGRYKPDTVTVNFIKSFTQEKWGIANKAALKITDVLNRLSLMGTYIHLTRVTIPQKQTRKSKTMTIREVQQTQVGYICTSHTADGDACGITKHLASTCHISVERNPDILIEYFIPYLSGNRSDDHQSPLLVNGILLGWVNGPLFRDYCVGLRREGKIYYDTCIVLDQYDHMYVYTDEGRPTRPLLVVDPDGRPTIERKNLWDAPFNELVKEGCIEYVDAFEQEYIHLAMSLDRLEEYRTFTPQVIDYYEQTKQALEKLRQHVFPTEIKRGNETITIDSLMMAEAEMLRAQRLRKRTVRTHPFTHCEMDPQATLGIGASLMPNPEESAAPRRTYHANMGLQAMGIYSAQYQRRFDTTAKVLAFPTRAVVSTQVAEEIGMGINPSGMTITLAIMPWRGFNQEDGCLISQAAIDRGAFWYVKYTTLRITLKQEKDYHEEYMVPELRPSDDKTKFTKLDERGIIRIGSKIEHGDCLVARVRVAGLVKTPNYVFVGLGETGVVENLTISPNINKNRVITIRIRDVRRPMPGDKLASRYSQKATIGRVVPATDMPFPSDPRESPPDILLNPLCIPSRMTINKLLEVLTSRDAGLRGQIHLATAFRPFDIETLRASLHGYGFNPDSLVNLVDGVTGITIRTQIFSGPCYYGALKHNVLDKIQERGRGALSIVTHQPVAGRQRGGGGRVGEMERDNLIAHGGASLLQERTCYASDPYEVPVCTTCGTIAITKATHNTLICRNCGDEGKFGVVLIPYSTKRFMSLLTAIGIMVKMTFVQPKEE